MVKKQIKKLKKIPQSNGKIYFKRLEKRLKILITGSSGFIGTSFISKFYNDFDIISVIRDAKKKKKVQIVKKIKVETTLIEDKKIIKIIKNTFLVKVRIKLKNYFLIMKKFFLLGVVQLSIFQ